jgi:hypothetical protein
VPPQRQPRSSSPSNPAQLTAADGSPRSPCAPNNR